MSWHDAELASFGPWWRRQVRSGHAYAEVLHLQGWRPGAYWFRNVLSIVFWAGLLPAVVLLFAWPTHGISLLSLSLLVVLWLRFRRHVRNARDFSAAEADLFATGCVVAKFAQLRGGSEFLWRRLVRRQQTPLIEYKRTANDPAEQRRS